MRALVLGSLLSVVVFSACDERCVAGEVAACTCADGGSGTSTCSAERAAGECVCEPVVTGGGGGSMGGGAGGGAGGGTTVDAGPATVSLEVFCADIAEAACDARVKCGEYSEAGRALCVERERALWSAECARVDAGTRTFNGVSAAACLARFDGDAPVCPTGTFDACGMSPITGATAVFVRRDKACGAVTCGASEHCDLSCEQPTCRPYRQPGESCSDGRPSTECEPSTAYCASLDGGASECVRFPAVGQACPSGFCGAGSRCVGEGADAGCEALKTDGVACSSDLECLGRRCHPRLNVCGITPAGQGCTTPTECGAPVTGTHVCRGLRLDVDGGVVTAGICNPRPQRGDACNRGWAAPSDVCPVSEGLACLDGECTSPQPLSRILGAECPLRPWGFTSVPFFGFRACAAGLTCQRVSGALPPHVVGRCFVALLAGEACVDDSACGDGLTCRAAGDGGSVCTPRDVSGASCGVATCFEELTCAPVDGGAACSSPVALGGACAPTTTCVAGARCFGGVCTALGGSGDGCTSGEDCASGACGDALTCVAACVR